MYRQLRTDKLNISFGTPKLIKSRIHTKTLLSGFRVIMLSYRAAYVEQVVVVCCQFVIVSGHDVYTRGDQNVLQLGYKKLTYYITHAAIF